MYYIFWIFDFFSIFNSSQNSVFLLSILKIPKDTKQITKKFLKFLEKQNWLASFAENVVNLGVFGISGLIPKIFVLLNFSIEIFSVFNSIEISVLKIFGIQ